MFLVLLAAGACAALVWHRQVADQRRKRQNDLTQRERTGGSLREANESLERTVAERTADLQATTEELAATNKELACANQELQAANAQARMTNKDLASLNERLVLASDETTEANRAKSEFLSNVSHELRTPLNAVIGFSDVMMRGMAGSTNEEQHRQLSMINGAGKHLLAIVNDILDLSRIEAGHFDIGIEEVDCARLGTAALDTVRPLATQRGLDLRLEIPREPCSIHTDARRVLQILLNLLGNAVKFSERGSVTLTISSAAEDGIVRLSVSDMGIGIAPDRLESVFDEFQQFDAPFLAKPEGTGLGLAVSRRLAAALGGTLEVASTLGVGSVFTLALPASGPPPA